MIVLGKNEDRSAVDLAEYLKSRVLENVNVPDGWVPAPEVEHICSHNSYPCSLGGGVVIMEWVLENEPVSCRLAIAPDGEDFGIELMDDGVCKHGHGADTLDQAIEATSAIIYMYNHHKHDIKRGGEDQETSTPSPSSSDSKERVFIVHPDGTDEIYNLTVVQESEMPEFFRQHMFTTGADTDDSWMDAADRWLFYDATDLPEDRIDEIVKKHNKDAEKILDHSDFVSFEKVGFNPEVLPDQ